MSAITEAETEDIPFKSVLDNLNSAATLAIETEDYLSYSTLIDYYFTPRDKYTLEEREQLLATLLNVLEQNHQIVAEIGWDLPALLITYVDSSSPVSSMAIKDTPCVYKVMKLFEVLALFGNPKELLLKSCETLSDLKISDVQVEGLHSPDDVISYHNIKVYCLIELIDSCLKKIATRYPSRFLSMAITAIINQIYSNYNADASYMKFICKRVYVLASKYSPPPAPPARNVEGESAEELAKIAQDENSLIRKLLTAFISEVFDLLGRNSPISYSLDYITRIQENHRSNLKTYVDYKVQYEAVDRLLSLAQSYDMPLKDNFEKYLVKGHTIIHSLDLKQSEEAVTSQLFEKVTQEYINLQSSLISQGKEISDSVRGSLILFTHSMGPSQRWKELKSFTFNDSLAFTILSVVPGMVSNNFVSKSIQDISLFWGWVALHKSGCCKTKLDIQAIPQSILKVYFQCLLFMIVQHPTNAPFRYVTLTFLTKILSLSPESVAYDFLKDSLYHCPFENLRSTFSSVLKALLIVGQNGLSDLFSKMNIKETGKEKDDEIGVCGKVNDDSDDKKLDSSAFITLTSERALDLLDILDFNRKAVFGETLNISKVASLNSMLNLFVLIKDDPVFKEDNLAARLREILQETDKSMVKSRSNETEQNILNSIEILQIALDRIQN